MIEERDFNVGNNNAMVVMMRTVVAWLTFMSYVTSATEGKLLLESLS